jgi:hypothetical protein
MKFEVTDPIAEVICLSPKMYSILGAEQQEEEEDVEIEPVNKRARFQSKRCKGVPHTYVTNTLTHERYRAALLNDQVESATFIGIRSYNHQLFTETYSKRTLSSFDNKRYLMPDRISSLPYGHKAVRNIPS